MGWPVFLLGCLVYLALAIAYRVGWARGRAAGFRQAKVQQVAAWVGFMRRPVGGWRGNEERRKVEGPIPPREDRYGK